MDMLYVIFHCIHKNMIFIEILEKIMKPGLIPQNMN